ncbi:tRNA lysidine(34) synthetase TilS [Sporolactobacillus kofuensis]|uniref:tRNA(Ile)-lysidine synthase n=1 Tax=Sporolactobacillus kofuensis TaxID=269672 RepID=A0ABW1WGY8_9BACL|nr:tRNA lysidine(34) synthetase TilS [Sporolactobacillus kofuensis]MCO7176943.1 tRNA lysidine(34) synthetase TilS [Sporolactobacillus kofuensis]
MTFEETVTMFIMKHQMIRTGDRLLLGVSGGADSMALLQYFYKKRATWKLELAVCSVDHMLRGAESAEDVKYVASFCKNKDILFIGKTVDVRAYSKKKKISVETAARELRYRAFAEALHECRADLLVLAHHGDDQIETMLMRQVRGTVGMGRVGIPVKRVFNDKLIIRPFLSQTKKAIEHYCIDNGIVARQDATNESEEHTRNRFRMAVLPFLKQENPSVHLKFQYESECLAEDEALLQELAEKKLPEVVLEEDKEKYALSIPKLLGIHPALQRRTIHLLLCYLYTNQQMKPMHQPIHIEQLLQLLRSDRSSGRTVFPKGLSARKSYTYCWIGFMPKSREISEQVELCIPGETRCAAGCFKAEYITVEEFKKGVHDPSHLIVDTNAVSLPLFVRTFRHGDRMRPNGMSGDQKIQRIFINEKVDRDQRALWPLVTDGEGRVLWLPLLRRGSALPVDLTADKTNYLKLKFIPFAGFGRTQA